MQNSLVNKVTLIGNLGANPTTVELENNKKVVRFSLATTEFYKDQKGEKQSKTDWHSIVAWGKTADIVDAYVKKGQKVAIGGKLVSRTYETKEGETRYITEVQANDVLMLSSAKEDK